MRGNNTHCHHGRGQALALFLFSFCLGAVVSAERVQWIWGAPLEESVRLRKEFQVVRSEVDVVRLRVAGDFMEGEVLLNDHDVGQIYRGEPEVRAGELRYLLRDGENVLSVRGRRLGGPAAVAAELRLKLKSGKEQVIRSDKTWRVAGNEQAPAEFGSVETEEWWNLQSRPQIGTFDEYNQGVRRSTGPDDVSRFDVPKGFKLEVVHAGTKEDGSWVSLEVDPKGRYVIGKERKGIIRLTLEDGKEPKVETINDSLQACHGLLFAHNSLYVVANNSRGFFRLRDTNGDDQYDEVTRLQETPGGVGDHGRHALVLGKEGEIYAINGDATLVPDNFRSLVPATREFGESKRPLAGYLARTNADGEYWEVFASGIRNPFGVAMNEEGDLFTYDADSEAHRGLPWYRPTRIVHLLSGADHGWRRSDRQIWPAARPESSPGVTNIGPGSPTGVLFGTKSKFPPAYRRALFAFDWTYGRILAVHLVPQGGSYVGHAEVFLKGRPMNVVDLDFDGESMLFVTGGNGTLSTLYRLSYVGPETQPRARNEQEKRRLAHSKSMRRLRELVEAHHGGRGDRTVDSVWSFLDHEDFWVRHAARVALESQPIEQWKDRALTEGDAQKALVALLAMVRVGSPALDGEIGAQLNRIDLEGLSLGWKAAAVRIAMLIEKAESKEVCAKFEPLFPTGRAALDRDLAELLARHQSSVLVDRTLKLLDGKQPQQVEFHHLLNLARVKVGWTPERRTSYFRLLRGSQLYMGDRGVLAVVNEMKKTALGSAPEGERERLAQLLKTESDLNALGDIQPRAQVRAWTLKELAKTEADAKYEPNLMRGKDLYRAVLCAYCHRFGAEGRSYGPDLTAVASRFGREDFLRAVIEPSDRIATNHGSQIIKLRDGKTVVGRVVWNGFRDSVLHVATNPMKLEEVVKIPKREIVSHEESPVSPMPPGLLNSMTREEILDLLAYLGVQ